MLYTLYISNAATPYGGISKYSISCKLLGFLRISEEEHTVSLARIGISKEEHTVSLARIGISKEEHTVSLARYKDK